MGLLGEEVWALRLVGVGDGWCEGIWERWLETCHLGGIDIEVLQFLGFWKVMWVQRSNIYLRREQPEST